MLTSSAIKAYARDVGFDLCGVTRATTPPRLSRLSEWIARGHSGDMAYLANSCDERSDPVRVLPTVRSVVSLAVVYNTDHPCAPARDELDRAAIARYAWGEDYHGILRSRLRMVVRWMADTAGPGLEAFSCVDDGPVQERVFAEQAGIGWIGKNTCVINQSLGSWLFLAEILTNAELEGDGPAVDQCGVCTRCLDACPTGAIVEPYTVDATRCLSYLTIEARGGVNETLRHEIRQQVYGCDICQDVCPWNRRAAVSEDPAWRPRQDLAFPRLIDLCRLSDEDWRSQLKSSAMRRAGLWRLRRSFAYAAAALPPEQASEALDTLASHQSASHQVVKDAIEWARTRIEADGRRIESTRRKSVNN